MFHVTPPELLNEEFLATMFNLAMCSTIKERERYLCDLQITMDRPTYKWVAILDSMFHVHSYDTIKRLSKKVYIERVRARITFIGGYYDTPSDNTRPLSQYFKYDCREYRSKIVLFLENLDKVSLAFIEKDYVESLIESYKFELFQIPNVDSLRSSFKNVTVVTKKLYT